ncbi:MAG TPA: hypothetical protein VGV38_15750 [Pyrinomonadaceae bacterium]|nr:hypothetical protein [Pyrinomonadaceae bacterium]
MAQKKQGRTNRRTEVKELPKQEKELTRDEQKRVRGGVGETLAIIPSKPKPGA